MTDLLPFPDLPELRRAPLGKEIAPVIRCCICGSAEWIGCAAGTASNASRFADSRIAEFRATDEVPLVAWCAAHHPTLGPRAC